MNSTQLQAWISAKVLTEAKRRSQRPGAPKAQLAALRKLETYAVSGRAAQYGPAQNQDSKYVALATHTCNRRLRKRVFVTTDYAAIQSHTGVAVSGLVLKQTSAQDTGIHSFNRSSS